MSWFERAAFAPHWRDLGLVLLHSLWQGVLVAGLAAAFLRALRGRRAEERYWVGCLGLAAMAVFPVATWWRLSGAPVEPLVLGSPAVVSTLELRDIGPLAWTSWLWLAGVALGQGRLWLGYLRTQHLRRREAEPLDERWQACMRELCRRLGVGRAIRVHRSTLARVPALVGWLRPVVLVPAGAVTGLSPAELEAVLAHELAHYKRLDPWINALQSVLESLLFFHPAVWWLSARVREEREYCCDDLAVEVCGDPLSYARALASLDVMRCETSALVMSSTGGRLMHRIRRLVTGKGQARGRASAVAPLLFGGLSAALAAGTAFASFSSDGGEPAASSQTGGSEMEELDRRIEQLKAEIARLEAEVAAKAGARDVLVETADPRASNVYVGRRARTEHAPKLAAKDGAIVVERTGEGQLRIVDGDSTFVVSADEGDSILFDPENGTVRVRSRSDADANDDVLFLGQSSGDVSINEVEEHVVVGEARGHVLFGGEEIHEQALDVFRNAPHGHEVRGHASPDVKKGELLGEIPVLGSLFAQGRSDGQDVRVLGSKNDFLAGPADVHLHARTEGAVIGQGPHVVTRGGTTKGRAHDPRGNVYYVETPKQTIVETERGHSIRSDGNVMIITGDGQDPRVVELSPSKLHARDAHVEDVHGHETIELRARDVNVQGERIEVHGGEIHVHGPVHQHPAETGRGANVELHSVHELHTERSTGSNVEIIVPHEIEVVRPHTSDQTLHSRVRKEAPHRTHTSTSRVLRVRGSELKPGDRAGDDALQIERLEGPGTIYRIHTSGSDGPATIVIEGDDVRVESSENVEVRDLSLGGGGTIVRGAAGGVRQGVSGAIVPDLTGNAVEALRGLGVARGGGATTDAQASVELRGVTGSTRSNAVGGRVRGLTGSSLDAIRDGSVGRGGATRVTGARSSGSISSGSPSTGDVGGAFTGRTSNSFSSGGGATTSGGAVSGRAVNVLSSGAVSTTGRVNATDGGARVGTTGKKDA